MSASSLANPQTLNLYAYCGNDPINNTDPDGLFFGKLFKWIGKIFKWVAIVSIVVMAVLTIAPGAFAGTLMAKIGIWAIKHPILASLLGLHTPQWAIINLASTAGAAASGFWVMAGVGAVSGFLQNNDQAKKKPPCPSVPLAPSEANIDENIRTARRHGEMVRGPYTAYREATWLIDQVKAGAPWDYKKYDKSYDPKTQNSKYEDFGNFNYGATGAALGLSSGQLERMAGRVQDPKAPGVGGKKAGWLDARLGEGGEWPYGDQYTDNAQIKAGIEYYTRKFVKKDCQ
jgi:hypothetical protein